jgi:hypothetical protein
MYPRLHEYVHADAPVVGVTVANGFESHTAGLNPSGQYVLPSQFTQFCVCGSMYLPRAQWHTVDPAAEYLPVAHPGHTEAEASEYVLTPQTPQTVEATTPENVPDAQPSHPVLPEPDWYNPAAQLEHSETGPVSENFPATHSVQTVAAAAPENFPVPQASQAVLPEPDW